MPQAQYNMAKIKDNPYDAYHPRVREAISKHQASIWEGDKAKLSTTMVPAEFADQLARETEQLQKQVLNLLEDKKLLDTLDTFKERSRAVEHDKWTLSHGVRGFDSGLCFLTRGSSHGSDNVRDAIKQYINANKI